MALNADKEILNKQLSTLTGLYQHHLDLFLKWMTLYATIVAGIVVYVIKRDPTVNPSHFPLIIAVASAVAAIGCFIMWLWLKKLDKEVKLISTKLGESHYPSLLGLTMTVAAFVITVAFSVASMVYAFYVSSR